MHSKRNIRALLAGFMLVVFAISNTPRIVLHTLFASHKDAAGKKLANAGKLQIAGSSYNCNCVNVVAESPFTEPGNNFEFVTFQPLSLQQKLYIFTFYSARHLLYTLRGPPSAS